MTLYLWGKKDRPYPAPRYSIPSPSENLGLPRSPGLPIRHDSVNRDGEISGRFRRTVFIIQPALHADCAIDGRHVTSRPRVAFHGLHVLDRPRICLERRARFASYIHDLGGNVLCHVYRHQGLQRPAVGRQQSVQ